jgi:hypothetical protein
MGTDTLRHSNSSQKNKKALICSSLLLPHSRKRALNSVEDKVDGEFCVRDQMVMQEGKSFVLANAIVSLTVALKTGDGEIRVVSAIFIDDLAVVIADKLGAIGSAAQWASGGEVIERIE